MAFTRVRGPGITTDDNYRVGILTATKFVGPMQASGDSDFTNISATGIGTIDGVKIGDPSGIVTASSSSGIVTYYGDASKLTGLTAGQIPNLDGAKITSGTFDAARIPNLAASKITSGTVATARLGSGTASSSTFLRGDNTWATSGPATGDTYVKLRSTTGASATGTNTFAGSGAGAALNGSSGDHNTFYGRSAGAANDGGQNNVFLGSNAGVSNVSGHENVAIGQAAYENGTGEKNIAIGRRALQATTSSNSSVGIGYEALKSQTSGGQSVAIGHEAAKTVTGSQNVAIGHVALKLGENTNHNTIVGAFAGDAITSGEGNTALGRNCLSNLQTGTNCIAIGRGASASSTSVSNEITFGDANITKFRIPGLNYYNVAGDVGIGTATPSEKLTVHTASGNTKQVLSSHAGFSELDFVTASTLRADVFANASEFTFTTRTAIPIVFRTNGTNERLRIDSNGNIGAGTGNTTIDEALCIERAGNVTVMAECNTSGSGANAAFRLKSADSSSDWYMQAGNVTSGGLRFYDGNAGAERLHIDSNGMSKFTRGSTGTVGHFYANARECNILLQNDARTWKIVNYDYGNNGTDHLGFHDGTADRLIIGNAGQLGLSGTNYGSSGQILTSGGSSGACQWASPFTSDSFQAEQVTDQTMGTNAWNPVKFNAQNWDTGNNYDHNSGNWYYTAPSTGKYWYKASLELIGLGQDKIFGIGLYIDTGSGWTQQRKTMRWVYQPKSGNNVASIETTGLTALSSGNKIRVYCYHDHGSNRNLDDNWCIFEMFRLGD